MSRNRCDTTCECGLTFGCRPELRARSAEDLMTGEEYLKAIDWPNCPYRAHGYGEGPTLFGKVVCPLCLVEYVGWFRPAPAWSDTPKLWEIYDTSYWSAYNDEPGIEDIRNRRDAAEVLASLNPKSEKQP